MTTFKIGDRVRRTAEGLPGRIVKGGEYLVVEGGVTNRIKLEGDPGLWDSDNFELVTPAGKTDEELANEYRDNYARQREISKELRERGYTPEWRAPHRGVQNWTVRQAFGQPDELRFVKTIQQEI